MTDTIARGTTDLTLDNQVLTAFTPIGRFGEPSDIAAAALYLASDDSKFMVGAVISPNRGYVI